MSLSSTSSVYEDASEEPPQLLRILSNDAEFPSARGLRPPPDVARDGGHPVHYTISQAFGEKGADAGLVSPVQEADMISAVRFAHSEDLVATGDKGGRIVILQRVCDSKYTPAEDDREDSYGGHNASNRPSHAHPASAGRANGNGPARRARVPSHASAAGGSGTRAPGAGNAKTSDGNGVVRLTGGPTGSEEPSGGRPRPPSAPNFAFWTQFQSHEPEFDYLKSMEIEEKINQIRWCRRINGDNRLIATNDKTIKIWRVFEKEVSRITSLTVHNLHGAGKPCGSLSSPISSPSSTVSSTSSARSLLPRGSFNFPLPALERRGSTIQATPRRVFSNAHAYHINSISLNSDEETFISADDLRVNMWNLNVGGDGFTVLDIKPENMEELTEVITCAEFHPQHCHIFSHATSRGIVKLCDLRQSALCQKSCKSYEAQDGDSSGMRSSFFSEIIASVSDVKFSPDGRFILTRDYMNLRLWDLNMERSPVLVVPVHEHLRGRLSDLYENDSIFDKFQCAFSSNGGSLLTGSYNSLFNSYSASSGEGVGVEASVDFATGMSGRHRLSSDGSSIGSSPPSELFDPSRRILHLDSSSVSAITAVAAGPALYIYFGDGAAAASY